MWYCTDILCSWIFILWEDSVLIFESSPYHEWLKYILIFLIYDTLVKDPESYATSKFSFPMKWKLVRLPWRSQLFSWYWSISLCQIISLVKRRAEILILLSMLHAYWSIEAAKNTEEVVSLHPPILLETDEVIRLS